MPKTKTIGEAIQEARVKRGMTQRQVEDMLGSYRLRDAQGRRITLSEAGLSRIEAGGRMPSYSTLVALASALRIVFIIGPDGTDVIKEEDV